MISCKSNLVFETKNIDEAKEAANDIFSFDQVPLLFGDIKVSDEGTILIQDTPFEISAGGISNLCSCFKIPDAFANRIPVDLFQKNVNRLSDEYKNEKVNVYLDKKETIIDVNTSKYTPIPSFDLLNKINFDFKRISFENHLMMVEVLDKDSKDISFANELHNLGVSISHYPTAKNIPIAFLMLYTLICTNGAILPKRLGREKFSIKASGSIDQLMDRFNDRIGYLLNKTNIGELISNMEQEQLEFGQIEKIVKKVKRLVGKEEVSEVFKSRTAVKLTELDLKKEVLRSNELTDITKYDIYYDLTNYASNMGLGAMQSRKMKTMAGNLLLEDLTDEEL